MSTLSIKTCTMALNGAALSRKAAFQTELAVGLAVFLIEHGTHKTAKTVLTAAYASAGYQCMTPEDIDYKTINRRVNASADLFNSISERIVKKWAGEHNEADLLRAMIEGLRPYELWSVSDVLRFCEPSAPNFTVMQKVVPIKPDMSILDGPKNGHEQVLDMFNKAADHKKRGEIWLKTEHVTLLIPKGATRDELIELATHLMELAESKKKATA